RSTDSGNTWTLLTETDGKNPLFGLAVSKIIVDYGLPRFSPFTPPQPNWSPVNTPTGRIYVATSDVVSNRPAGTGRAGVYRFDSSTTQVQTLTVPTLTGAGTFKLSFRGSTTRALNVNSQTLASEIKNALTPLTFASIGGLHPVAGHAIVSQSTINPLVFKIALAGSLLPPAAPPPQNPPTPLPLITAAG